jgi:hypothetical protein
MAISIATALKDGATVYCLVQETEVISSHSTIKEAVDARRNLKLPIKSKLRETYESAPRAVQHEYR